MEGATWDQEGAGELRLYSPDNGESKEGPDVRPDGDGLAGPLVN